MGRVFWTIEEGINMDKIVSISVVDTQVRISTVDNGVHIACRCKSAEDATIVAMEMTKELAYAKEGSFIPVIVKWASYISK